jgi:hypothetical protein
MNLLQETPKMNDRYTNLDWDLSKQCKHTRSMPFEDEWAWSNIISRTQGQSDMFFWKNWSGFTGIWGFPSDPTHRIDIADHRCYQKSCTQAQTSTLGNCCREVAHLRHCGRLRRDSFQTATRTPGTVLPSSKFTIFRTTLKPQCQSPHRRSWLLNFRSSITKQQCGLCHKPPHCWCLILALMISALPPDDFRSRP